MNIIVANNVAKSFKIKGADANLVFSGLDFELQKSKFTVIKGASGIGKSTFLYILGAIETPDSGDIVFTSDDKVLDYSKMNDKAFDIHRNLNIGFIFQFHHLLPEFTCLENVMIPALIAGKKHSDAMKLAEELLERVGVSHRAKHKPAEISGGEQQRVAIARSLINNPKVLLADEPTGNLDKLNSDNVLNLLVELRKSLGITLLITTHSDEVAKRADLVYEMSSNNLKLINLE